jgi:hypothetical protein
MNDLLAFLVSWLPFVALIAVWVLLTRRSSASGAVMTKLYEQQVAEARRMNANLEKIVAALERRPQA